MRDGFRRRRRRRRVKRGVTLVVEHGVALVVEDGLAVVVGFRVGVPVALRVAFRRRRRLCLRRGLPGVLSVGRGCLDGLRLRFGRLGKDVLVDGVPDGESGPR